MEEHNFVSPRVSGSMDQWGTHVMLSAYRCNQGRERSNMEMKPKRFFFKTNHIQNTVISILTVFSLTYRAVVVFFFLETLFFRAVLCLYQN